MKLITGIFLVTHGFLFCQAACPAGKHVSAVLSSTCTGCAHGKYQNSASFTGTECKLCPGGKFQNAVQQATCKICTAGKFQEQTSQTECKSCTYGTFSRPEAKQCSSCISEGAKKYQNAAESGDCKTCATCSTVNARSGFGQQCLGVDVCNMQEPTIVFLTSLKGTGYDGMLSSDEFIYAKQVFKDKLGLSTSESAQLYLLSIKNTVTRRLNAAKTRIYELSVFENILYSGTLTDVELDIKNNLTSSNKSIEVFSFVAQNQAIVEVTGDSEESSLSVGAAVGIGVGATILAALPVFAKGAEPALVGGKALGTFAKKQKRKLVI